MDLLNAYVSGDGVVTTVQRDGSGNRIVRAVPAENVVFMRAPEVPEDIVRQLRASRYVRSIREQGEWLRVGFLDRTKADAWCFSSGSPARQLGIATYEGDVSPALRHVIESGAKIAKPRRAYLDFETDSRLPFSRKEEMRILSWALVDEQASRRVAVLSRDDDRAERDLIAELWDVLVGYDQVLCWNGENFDFDVFKARTRLRGLASRVDWRHWLWLDQMLLFERMNKHAAESGEEKQSMALNAIAQAVLGEGKEETPPEVVERFGRKSLGSLAWQLWDAGGSFRALLARYNLRDTALQQRIEAKTGYVALFDSLCEACHVFGDTRGLNPTHQMDGFMIALGGDGYKFPSKSHRARGEKFKGAYVMEPKTRGVAKGVHVADFAGLYPSIILTWNMSPETLSTKESAPVEGRAWSPLTGWTFDVDEEGILPKALKELLAKRKYWNDLKATFPPGSPEWHDANRKSTAYKVAANSFYGVVGSAFSRFFDKRVAESITQCGVWLILKTIEAAEARGWKVVYGDTDSLFVTGCTRQEFAAFVDWCNESLYPQALADVGCVENYVKLGYEKAFDRIVFTSAKRYVASYLHFKGKDADATSKPEIKGLEYMRGDSPVLARTLQGDVIHLICGGPDAPKNTPSDDLARYHEVVGAMRDYVLNGSLPIEQVRIAKGVQKALGDYKQKVKKDGTPGAQPPHVVVAKILAERGEEVMEGTRIEYVVVDAEAKGAKRFLPASDYEGECDRFYLWESLVYPPTQRLLEAAFPDEDWRRWLKVRPAKARKGRGIKASAAPPLLGPPEEETDDEEA